jgi:hypothetical protein
VVASQYSARRELARTDSGALFEAWDMVLERTVVLKLAWRDPGSPSLLAEGRRCAGVASDAAAAIYSMGHHRGAEVLVGEFLPATSLRDQLAAYARRRGPPGHRRAGRPALAPGPSGGGHPRRRLHDRRPGG